ncbi:MAG TPA: DUF3619 family protein [Burkholderiaceae bacterium]
MNAITQNNPHEALQDRFGRRLAARLDQAIDPLDYDITERLRAARMQALAKRKVAQPQFKPANQTVINRNGPTATLGWRGGPRGAWWGPIVASVVPILVLAAGLFVINANQAEDQAREVADVDTALLTDDLPPTAYADPGFLQFLKVNGSKHEP